MPTHQVLHDGSITAINDGAFCRQYHLKEINIPKGVKSIGTYAFSSPSGKTTFLRLWQEMAPQFVNTEEKILILLYLMESHQ